MKQVTNLKCNNCDYGIVKLIVSKVRDMVSASVNNCSCCKRSFGLKSVSQLRVLDTEEVNALSRNKDLK